MIPQSKTNKTGMTLDRVSKIVVSFKEKAGNKRAASNIVLLDLGLTL